MDLSCKEVPAYNVIKHALLAILQIMLNAYLVFQVKIYILENVFPAQTATALIVKATINSVLNANLDLLLT